MATNAISINQPEQLKSLDREGVVQFRKDYERLENEVNTLANAPTDQKKLTQRHEEWNPHK